MPLRYLLDENLRGPLWRAILRHNAQGLQPLDVRRVGDLPELPLASEDDQILLWASREERILLSHDAKTLAVHLAKHLDLGLPSPGIFLLRRRCALGQVVAFLIEAAYSSDPKEWQNRIEYIP